MARKVVTAGSAVSFVMAAVAGVLGNQLTKDALWAWVAFGATLVLGACITAIVTHRGAPEPAPAPRDGQPVSPARRRNNDTPPQGAPLGLDESAQVKIEGPVAGNGVYLDGTNVAGHDITFNGVEPPRGEQRR